jgi:transposase
MDLWSPGGLHLESVGEGKLHVLWLLENDFIPDDVADIFGVSRRSIYRWQANIENYGSVDCPCNPLHGHPRTLNADQTHDLFTLLNDAPEMFLDKIQEWVAITQDLSISKTALHVLIRDAGITYKVLRKAASERDEEARERFREFARNHLVASMIITVDESSKDDRTIFRRRGRAPSGHRAEINADFVHGERYSILAAMAVEGFVGTRVVEGSVDSDEFFDFIVEDIVCISFTLIC